MPRPRSTPVPDITRAPPVAVGPDGHLVLDRPSQQLVDEVSQRWELTVPVAAMLRIVAEQRTIAAACDRVLQSEGLLVSDAKGAAKCHPLLLIARDLRAQSSQTLHKLLAHLG